PLFMGAICRYFLVDVKSLQGHFLIAMPNLTDPNFFRTIVLIVQHNESGALGLILNRPSRATVAEVAEKLLEDPGSAIDGYVHQGGPCDGPLMVLHDEESAADLTVLDDVFFSTDRSKLEWLFRKHQGRARVFVGYSGWSPGQLEGELESNAWMVAPATAHEVFGGLPSWQSAATRAFLLQYVPAKRIPPDPRTN
ncbi:MAG: YqgE/AlgH family protein, partial [Phycisphaerae bacterium]|nr:YqgE/AlgH family protein [Phycisphaerae bacterium]